MLMDDLRGRLANRVQLTTDGHKAYLSAVEEAFGADIDYAMLVKLYGEPAPPRPTMPPRGATAPQSASASAKRRSPATPTRSTSARATQSGRT